METDPVTSPAAEDALDYEPDSPPPQPEGSADQLETTAEGYEEPDQFTAKSPADDPEDDDIVVLEVLPGKCKIKIDDAAVRVVEVPRTNRPRAPPDPSRDGLIIEADERPVIKVEIKEEPSEGDPTGDPEDKGEAPSGGEPHQPDPKVP